MYSHKLLVQSCSINPTARKTKINLEPEPELRGQWLAPHAKLISFNNLGCGHGNFCPKNSVPEAAGNTKAVFVIRKVVGKMIFLEGMVVGRKTACMSVFQSLKDTTI